MKAYLLKRLLATIPTLFGITLITFLLIRMAPGDPVSSRFDLSGGGPGADGGGAQDADRLQDTARAKKQLLGMVRHDNSLHRWRPELGPVEDEGAIAPLPEPERLGEFEGWPQAVAVDAARGRLWVGGQDQTLRALDPQSGEVLTRLTGHGAPIRSLDVHPDGGLLSLDDGGQLRLWAHDGAPGAVIDIGATPTEAIFLDPSTVLVAARDGVIRSYAIDGTPGRTYSGHIGAVYAIARDGHGGFWSGGVDRVLRRWTPDAEQPVLEEKRHGQAVTDIAVSGQAVLTACDDRKVRLFAAPPADGALAGPPAALDPPTVFEGHYKGVSAVAFAPGGRVWSGGRDETVRLWDAASGRQLGESPYNPGRIHRIAPLDALGDAFAGQLAAVGDTWIEVPLVTQYVAWLGRTLTFDFGRSFTDDEPVLRLIGKALPITLGLNILAIGIIYLVSIPLGILAAVKRAGWFDNISSIVLFLLYSIPNFWLATLLIMFLSSERNLNILPSAGLASPGEDDLSYLPWLWDRFLHLVLPVTVMVYAGFASLSRYVRTSMLEALGQDYVRTARAKGLHERVVVLKHAFRNALVTIVTLVANLLPRLFGGSLIIEVIFSINGMGKLAFDSILSRDYPVIMAITTLAAVMTLLGILISDLLYGVVDPRVKVDR